MWDMNQLCVSENPELMVKLTNQRSCFVVQDAESLGADIVVILDFVSKNVFDLI